MTKYLYGHIMILVWSGKNWYSYTNWVVKSVGGPTIRNSASLVLARMTLIYKNWTHHFVRVSVSIQFHLNIVHLNCPPVIVIRAEVIGCCPADLLRSLMKLFICLSRCCILNSCWVKGGSCIFDIVLVVCYQIWSVWWYIEDAYTIVALFSSIYFSSSLIE